MGWMIGGVDFLKEITYSKSCGLWVIKKMWPLGENHTGFGKKKDASHKVTKVLLDIEARGVLSLTKKGFFFFPVVGG